MHQLSLPLSTQGTAPAQADGAYRERLAALLADDLDFHGQYTAYATHSLHPFPAKFPPQLPDKFIHALTSPDDVVLDPMMGSGTTIVEALMADRRAVGFDIDPLALLLCRVKATPLPMDTAFGIGNEVLKRAKQAAQAHVPELTELLAQHFDAKTQSFVDYWFPTQSQIELMALVSEIEHVEAPEIRAFLQLTLSATIITKSAGVSLARDLAHTRPHKAKDVVFRSPLSVFEKRLQQNLGSMSKMVWGKHRAETSFGNAQHLPLADNSVDLIVTSPPYASNAIDYMRAHKFSLVWLGHSIDSLSRKRKEYVGGEATDNFPFETLPEETEQVVSRVAANDVKKGRVLHRYYSEMTRVLQSMFRVLRPGRAAIVVVGTSTLSGAETHVQTCLADIGKTIGFDVVGIADRQLDRNRRMMPARQGGKNGSQIEERMHEEYVIGFHKPIVASSLSERGAEK